MSRIIPLDKGDYIVARTEKYRRPFVMRVSAADKNTIEGVMAKDAHIQGLRTLVEIKHDEVVAICGPNPYPGKAYGADLTNLYRGRKTHDNWGDLNWFYQPKKDVSKELMAGFDKAYKLLKKVGLQALAGEDGVVWEILPYTKEKYGGMYIHSTKDKVPSRYQIRPEIMPATEYPYVITHEVGHRLHREYLRSKKLNSDWIKMYRRSLSVTTISKGTCEQILEALMEGDDYPSSFKGQLEEDLVVAYKLILKYISQIHGLSVHEMDVLWEAEDKDVIKDLWPTKSLSQKDLNPLVSEYATKNVRELIAESFSFYVIGKKLPKDVVKLVERSISYAKTKIEKEKE
jgi:hypothetical protein